MSQLVITVIAIVLTAMLAMATINYLPWWYKTASDTEIATRTSLVKLEQTYDVATRAAGGVPPTPTTDDDGGFAAHFLPIIKFTPALPTGYEWVYGKQPADGTKYAGLNYFCMRPVGSVKMDKGVYVGIKRAKVTFPADQVFLSENCDSSTTNAPEPAEFPAPLRVKLFVNYVPGITGQ